MYIYQVMSRVLISNTEKNIEYLNIFSSMEKAIDDIDYRIVNADGERVDIEACMFTPSFSAIWVKRTGTMLTYYVERKKVY